MDMFEQGVRNKLRFEYNQGNLLNMEDLYDLRLTGGTVSLNVLAKGLNKQLKEEEEESFVVQKSKSNVTLQLKFDIVKHIIEVKLEEAEVAKNASVNKAKREKIMSILANKEDEALLNMSKEDLEALL